MGEDELDRLLGIDVERSPLDRRARHLVEADREFLERLVAMRKAKSLTQDQVAERMDVGQSAVARIESGERDPRLSTLRRYAMAVGALIEHHVHDDEKAIVRPMVGGAHTEILWNTPTTFARVGRKIAADSAR